MGNSQWLLLLWWFWEDNDILHHLLWWPVYLQKWTVCWDWGQESVHNIQCTYLTAGSFYLLFCRCNSDPDCFDLSDEFDCKLINPGQSYQVRHHFWVILLSSAHFCTSPSLLRHPWSTLARAKLVSTSLLTLSLSWTSMRSAQYSMSSSSCTTHGLTQGGICVTYTIHSYLFIFIFLLYILFKAGLLQSESRLWSECFVSGGEAGDLGAQAGVLQHREQAGHPGRWWLHHHHWKGR